MGNKNKTKKTAAVRSGKARKVSIPFWKNKSNALLYNKKGESRGYLFLSFLIPFIIIWAMYIKFEVHPFGEKQILVTDLWHQYFPFFKELQDKLHHFSSLLFSWNTGLGTNFISVLSYYGASPLNILSIIFPLESSRDVLTLFLTIKVGCAGLFCAIFLKNAYGRNDFSITAFALCYALCDYIMGYYWNVIWIDTVALLPLVVLGTVKLFKEGKCGLYCAALALSLVANFYIGLFTCIFTVMVFAACVIAHWEGFKHSLIRLGQIIGATVLGIGMGAVVLIPAFLALQLTHSADNIFPSVIEYYEEWITMISNVIGFHDPTAKEGLPNIFCGMFAVILLGVYLRAKEIKIREKVITVIYLAFIIVSCNMNVLNYMWHGFHFTNMLPYRFSFLFSFILIAAGYRAFTVMSDNIKKYDIAAMLIAMFLTLLAAYSPQPEKAVVSSLIVCLAYVLVMLLYERKVIGRKHMNFLVFGVCTVEMCINAYIGVKTVTVTDYVSYPKNYESVTELMDMARDNDSGDDGCYRMELLSNYTINDSSLYGYRGVSQFSSTANENVTKLMIGLGIQASAAGNRYYYTESTPIVNMLLNIKYLVSHSGGSKDNTHLEKINDKDSQQLFKNRYYLPIGFVADEEVLDFEGSDVNQFNNQSELFSKLTGIDEDVYNIISVKDVGHYGVNVTKDSYGSYRYQIDNNVSSDETRFFKFNYTIPEDGPVYVTFNFDNVKDVQVKIGDGVLDTHSMNKYQNTYPVGEFKMGETMTLYAELDEENGGTGKVYVYQVNEDVLKRGYEKLLGGALEVTESEDTSIKGNVSAESDGVMYTSIPHDGGWKVYVDGKDAEVSPLKNAFVCFPVSAGEHTVEMKYSPPGFVIGLIITLASIAGYVLMLFFGSRVTVRLNEAAKRRVKAEVSEDTEEVNGEDDAES